MATTTQNLALIKPAGTDKIRIAQINNNMDIIDAKMGAVGNTPLQTQINDVSSAMTDKNLGSFSDAAALNTLLNNELGTMTNYTWRSIRVTASASFDSFINTYVYYGTLYRGGSTSYAHVMLYPNASPYVITGEVGTSGTWVYRRLATVNEVDAVSNAIGNLQVYTKTIPANGGTATIRTSSTMPCLIFTSYSAASTTFSGHYASIPSGSTAAYMPLFATGSKVTFSSVSGGGLTITNTHTAGISLIVIRLMGEAEVTITTASAS